MTGDSLDSVELVLAKVKDVFGDTFKTYYDGDPLAIPAFNLPALIVDLSNDDTTEGAMGEDDIVDSIVIKVVFDKRDDFEGDGNGVDTDNLTVKRIRKIVGQVNREAGQYPDKSLKHVVRTLVTEDFTAVLSDLNVSYGVNQRVQGAGLADITEEAHLTFRIQYSADTY